MPEDVRTIIGRVETSITEVIRTIPTVFKGADMVLTYLDSTPVMQAICLETLDEIGIRFERSAAALKIAEESVSAFLEVQPFEGFDEVLMVSPQASLLKFAAAASAFPSYELNEMIPDAYIRLLQSGEVMRYFSDGTYVVDSGLDVLLRAHFPQSKRRGGRLF